jgi:hypothetical protein
MKLFSSDAVIATGSIVHLHLLTDVGHWWPTVIQDPSLLRDWMRLLTYVSHWWIVVIHVPKTIVVSCASEYSGTIFTDNYVVGIENGYASAITQLSNGNQ